MNDYNSADYNYQVFDMDTEMKPFDVFSNNLHVGEKAPSFPLEDLATGDTIEMKELWKKGPVIIEFGSFT